MAIPNKHTSDDHKPVPPPRKKPPIKEPESPKPPVDDPPEGDDEHEALIGARGEGEGRRGRSLVERKAWLTANITPRPGIDGGTVPTVLT